MGRGREEEEKFWKETDSWEVGNMVWGQNGEGR
jgi:hypothetical protein